MDITKKAVLDAVNIQLAKAFDDCTIYRNREPVKFLRPALLIISPYQSRASAAKNLVAETLYLTVTCLPQIDDTECCDTDILCDMQQKIIDLFAAGYIIVGERAIKIIASSGGQDLDRAWVDITCQYHISTAMPDDAPKIGKIETNYKT